MTTPIRILLVEDYPIFRVGMRTLLAAQPDLDVVAEATEAGDVVELCQTHHPTLVVLPIRLDGEFKGVELCRELKERFPDIYVLVCTTFTDTDDIAAMYLSGADSFLNKGAHEARLLDVVRRTARGEKLWNAGADPKSDANLIERRLEHADLTKREREVFGFVVQRYSNPEIARELFVTVPTVKTHVTSIMRKLGVQNRKDLFGGRDDG